MEPKNYGTIRRSILKKEQGKKIAPYIFKNKQYSGTWNLPRGKKNNNKC